MLDSLGEQKSAVPLNDRMRTFIKNGNFGQKIVAIFKSQPEQRFGYNGVSHLHKIREFYGNELGPAVMKEFHDEILGRPGPDIYVEGREELVQPMIEWFIGNLIDHKESFQYVFRTSRGSTYFVLPTGESLRFKMAHRDIREGAFWPVKREKPLEKPYIEVDRVWEKTYFVDEAEDSRIKDEREKTTFIDIDVQTIPFGIGTIPLEIIPSYSHKLQDFMPVEADERGLVHMGENIHGHHLGTPVTEVIHAKK